jgi:hypothetical protein
MMGMPRGPGGSGGLCFERREWKNLRKMKVKRMRSMELSVSIFCGVVGVGEES